MTLTNYVSFWSLNMFQDTILFGFFSCVKENKHSHTPFHIKLDIINTSLVFAFVEVNVEIR